MRQPEVGRLAALLAALLLALPALAAARAALVAGALLVEFLSAGAWAPLTRAVRAPVRTPLGAPGVDADRYVVPALRPPRPLVLVHGVTPEGKDDPRVRQAAALLARAGFAVAVPTVPGLTRGRLRPEDVEPVVATLAAAGPGRLAMLAVSLGAGPALLAAADPRVRDRVAVVVALGAYASGPELLRFFLTGDYAFGPVRGRVDHDPAVVEHFLRANAELLPSPEDARRLSRDRAAAAAFVADPPPRVRALLDALSPVRVLPAVRARLVLVHGRGDRAVPYTESLRLAAARPAGTTVAVVGAIGHVEGASVWEGLGDAARAWAAVYRLLALT